MFRLQAARRAWAGRRLGTRGLTSAWAGRRLVTRGLTSASPEEVRAAMGRLAEHQRPPAVEAEPTRSIFVNTPLKLSSIRAYGFDYDYTLVQYDEARLNQFLYSRALGKLVEQWRYPPEMLAELQYDPHFATRGLHFDVRHGTLIKLDCNYMVQPTAVTLGRELLPLAEAEGLYPEGHMSKSGQSHLKPIHDEFAVPEANLLADTVSWFRRSKIKFKPEYLAEDVQKAIGAVHISGELYAEVSAHPGQYILPLGDELDRLLSRLKAGGMQLFIVTNSPYWFMDAGMAHLLGKRWADRFDVIVTSAGKPGFFTKKRDFRLMSKGTGRLKWGEMPGFFEPGAVYAQGSVVGMMKRVPWRGDQVLYFGDHLHSDLVQPVREFGWRTGCIVREIEDEVSIRSSAEQQRLRDQLRELEALLRGCAEDQSPEVRQAAEVLQRHRTEVQAALKQAHNKYFGSMFRTHNRPSLFMEQMTRYADLYTSRVTNLLNYPLDCTLYPRRTRLPHEKSAVLKYSGEFLPEV